MTTPNIKTLDELIDYVSQWKRTIYVREQVDGRWDSYSLTELPSDLAIDHALRFIKKGMVPVRVNEEISQ